MSRKTNKSAKKRFKVTKKGKVMYNRGPKAHFRAKKTGGKIRQLGNEEKLDETVAKKIKKAYLPHE